MGTVLLDLATSLDGFVCGPNGEDGGLHDWYFSAKGSAARVIDELIAGDRCDDPRQPAVRAGGCPPIEPAQ